MTTAGQIYQNIAALEPVKRILEEADKALNDCGRTIATSDIPRTWSPFFAHHSPR